MVPPDDVADAAQNDQQTGDDVDHGIGGVIAEAVFSNDVDACIAERGDGGEHRDPDTPPAEFRNEYRHVKQGTDTLHQECACKHPPHKPNDAGKTVEVKCILDQKPVADAHAFMQQDHQGGHDGDHAKSAHLDQDQNDGMTKGAPGGGSGKCHQSGDAGGSGGGKQRIQIRDALALSGTDRKRQKKASQQYGYQKAQQNNMGGG